MVSVTRALAGGFDTASVPTMKTTHLNVPPPQMFDKGMLYSDLIDLFSDIRFMSGRKTVFTKIVLNDLSE